MNPEISLVVPILSGSRGVQQLLQSILEQQDAPSFEVHLVFNPRLDEVINPGLSSTQLKIWSTPRLGVNYARNFAVERALGRWIYFLDSDCRLHNPQHLKHLGEYLRVTSEDVICGGSYELALPASRVSQAYQLHQSNWVVEGANASLGWTHFLGGNMAVARSAFQRLRFDDDIIFGGSETDFVARWTFRFGGRGQFFPNLPVQHVHNMTKEELVRKAFLQGFGYERLVARDLRIRKSRQSLIQAAERRGVSDLLKMFADTFAIGRLYYVDFPNQYPTGWKMKKYLFTAKFKKRLYYPTAFGEELERWLRMTRKIPPRLEPL